MRDWLKGLLGDLAAMSARRAGFFVTEVADDDPPPPWAEDEWVPVDPLELPLVPGSVVRMRSADYGGLSSTAFTVMDHTPDHLRREVTTQVGVVVPVITTLTDGSLYMAGLPAYGIERLVQEGYEPVRREAPEPPPASAAGPRPLEDDDDA